MTALADLLDALVAHKTTIRAASRLYDEIQGEAVRLVVGRYHDEGTDRFRRPGGIVSLVRPSAHAEIVDPDKLCAWLESAGRSDLIVQTPVIVDAAALVSAVSAIVDRDERVDLGATLAALLVRAVDVRSEPVADWADHLDPAIDGEMMVTDNGEIIPGVRWVAPEPRSIRVAPDRQSVDAAKAALAEGGP